MLVKLHWQLFEPRSYDKNAERIVGCHRRLIGQDIYSN